MRTAGRTRRGSGRGLPRDSRVYSREMADRWPRDGREMAWRRCLAEPPDREEGNVGVGRGQQVRKGGVEGKRFLLRASAVVCLAVRAGAEEGGVEQPSGESRGIGRNRGRI